MTYEITVTIKTESGELTEDVYISNNIAAVLETATDELKFHDEIVAFEARQKSWTRSVK